MENPAKKHPVATAAAVLQPGKHDLVLQQKTSSSSNPEKSVFGSWVEQSKSLSPFHQKARFRLLDQNSGLSQLHQPCTREPTLEKQATSSSWFSLGTCCILPSKGFRLLNTIPSKASPVRQAK